VTSDRYIGHGGSYVGQGHWSRS